MALAFAVAASANLPVILLTLYWKRCNTAGVVCGLVVGTVAAIGLVLVSPNMTYPLQHKATQQTVIAANTSRIVLLRATLDATDDPATQAELKQAIGALDKATAVAHAEIAKVGNATASLVGLEKPLFELRNPGLISIPLGFLAVILGSLCYRDPRAEVMWEELYVRSNTGLGRAELTRH